MNYQKPSFSVPMPSHVKNWPFKSRPEPDLTVVSYICPRCFGLCVPGATHKDARDTGRVRQRICFGARQ